MALGLPSLHTKNPWGPTWLEPLRPGQERWRSGRPSYWVPRPLHSDLFSLFSSLANLLLFWIILRTSPRPCWEIGPNGVQGICFPCQLLLRHPLPSHRFPAGHHTGGPPPSKPTPIPLFRQLTAINAWWQDIYFAFESSLCLWIESFFLLEKWDLPKSLKSYATFYPQRRPVRGGRVDKLIMVRLVLRPKFVTNSLDDPR